MLRCILKQGLGIKRNVFCKTSSFLEEDSFVIILLSWRQSMSVKEMTENEIDQVSGGLALPIDDLLGSRRPRPIPIPWPNPGPFPPPYPYPNPGPFPPPNPPIPWPWPPEM
jgi:hypothetical protein